MISIAQARIYFPDKHEFSDASLLSLIKNLDSVADKLLDDYFGLTEDDDAIYNTIDN